jgi:hypothetical protein
LWLAGAALAGLRVAVNDSTRQPDRDSGPQGNALNDLIGAIAELVALQVLEDAGATSLTHSVLDLYRPIDRLDVQGELGGNPFRLEVKGHFQESEKRYFLINQRAQARSRQRGAHGHLPIVTRMLHSTARVGRVIGIDEVEQPPWQPPRPFGPRNDRAFPLRLQVLTAMYLGGSLLPQGIRLNMTEEMDHAYQHAQASLGRLRASSFTLDNLAATEIVHTLNKIAVIG